jgi:DNA invertase Pin-like site-specific DNA recombinase
METREWYYGRVSSSSQSLARQLAKFKELGADDRQIITDKESGKDFNRQGYLALKNQLLRDGDTITVCSIDRLGRNKAQIKEELEYFKAHNIRVKILDIPTTLIEFPQGQEWVCDMVNNILIEVLGSIAERERDTIRSRQAAGILEAKKDPSIKFGRPKAEKPANWDKVIAKWQKGEIKAVEAMKELNLTKATFYKFVKEAGIEKC